MRRVLDISAGLIVWAVAFSLLYGLHGAGCAWGWERQPLGPTSLHRAALIGVWAVTLAATLAGLLMRLRAARGAPAPNATLDRLTRRGALAGWVAGVAALVITGLPVVFASQCV